MYAVPLAELSDKFAVRAVGFSNEPIIHLVHMRRLTIFQNAIFNIEQPLQNAIFDIKLLPQNAIFNL